MGLKLLRKKPRHLLLSFFYKLCKLPFASAEGKLKLYLDLEWIFERFASEQSFRVYQPVNHPVRLQTKYSLLNRIDNSQSILDLGCNLGDMSFWLSEKARRVVGIDHNPLAIATAQKRYQADNLTFVCADALKYLKANQDYFDVLILSHILEHLDNPQEFLGEFRQYFDYIYIEVPDFDKSYLNHYRKELGVSLIYTDSDHVTEFDRCELDELLRACDLKPIWTEYRFGLQKIWCKVLK